MKRVLLGILLLCTAAAIGFGRGSQEADNALWFRVVKTGTSETNRQFDVLKNAQGGTVGFTLPIVYEAYAIIRIQVENSVQYYNILFEPIAIQNDIDAIETLLRDNIKLQPDIYEVQNNLGIVTLAQYGKGNITLSAGLLGILKTGRNTLNIPIKDFHKDVAIEVVLFDNKLHTYEYLKCICIPEFFKDEYKLFNEQAFNTYTYQEKALAFMQSFFKDDSFKQIVCDKLLSGVSPNAPFWNMFSDALKNNLIQAGLFTTCQNNFRMSFTEQFNFAYDKVQYTFGTEVKEYALPYLEFGEGTFNALYGGARNIYINAFIYYAYYRPRTDNQSQRGKPLLSDLFEKSIPGEDIPYYYEDYALISKDEGEKLAEYALRFFTGGVEYTPFSGVKLEKGGIAENRVFGTNFDFIKNWVGNGGTSRENNYLPGRTFEKADITPPAGTEPVVPKEVQILEPAISTNSILIKPRLKPGKTFDLARIDIWTSRNIAWDSEVIVDAGNIKIEGNSKQISDADKMKICDKRIAGGGLDESGAKANNLHLERSGQNNISVTYNFSKPQKVGAILIVRGLAAETKGKKPPNQYLQLKIGNKIFEKGSDGISEYVDFSTSDQIQFKLLGKANFGESLWSADYSRDGGLINIHVVYSYFVLDEPIPACSSISIIDLYDNANSNSFLNIAEFMVFSENPLQNLKHVGSNNYSLLKKADPVFTRGNFKTPYTIKGNQLNIAFRDTVNIEQVVLWEAGNNPQEDSSIFADKTAILYGPLMNIYADEYFSAQTVPPEFFTDLHNKLKTPFLDNKNRRIYGNPLPYAAFGMDSPRTFAYKMYEQWRARMYFSYKKTIPGGNRILGRFPKEDVSNKNSYTTTGEDETGFKDYAYGYVNEIDIFKLQGTSLTIEQGYFIYENYNVENGPQVGNVFSSTAFKPYESEGNIVKPFLPGLVAGNDLGYVKVNNSLYSADKVAGVDSVGLLLGSIAMGENLYANTLSAFNQEIAKNLDRYYKMSAGDVKGLGMDGKPVFYAPGNSMLDGACRFARPDLERGTVLVPDLCEVQEGDLLVKYDVKGTPHIGIIVALGWKLKNTTPPPRGSDIRLYWDQVYVVSVRAGFQMVSLGVWGNPDMMMGGFTVEPQAYQIRRLLKKIRDLRARPANVKDDWELVKDPVDKLTCTIDLPENFDAAGTTNHWVPNTNDGLGPIYITFKGINEGQQEMSLVNYDITLLPPVDQYFSDTEGEQSNIYSNKGTGIQLWVEGEDANGNKKDYLLATFMKRPFNEIVAEKNQLGNNEKLEDRCYVFGVDPNGETAYVDDSGKAINGCRLYVDATGKLVFEKDGKSSDIFYVKAIQNNNIRPGDDFLLKFGIEGSNAVAKANDGDFIAVYDKKMLWRANLYIKEEFNDWNDLNPWNSDDNEWNKNYNGWDILPMGNNEPYLGELNSGAGNQTVDIMSSTWHKNDPNSSTNVNVENAVVYSVTCHDSPFEFNSKMQEQRILLEYSMKNSKNDYSGGNNNSVWGNTLAPGTKQSPYNQEKGKWENYIEGEDGTTIGGIKYYPYRPGLSSSNVDFGLTEEGKDIYWWAHEIEIKRSAGVDCVGLIQRSASYNSSKYIIEKITGYSWITNNIGGTRRFPTIENNKLWIICDKDPTTTIPKGIEKVIPGDIIYYSGHVMMVLSVKYEVDKERKTNISNILLIESTVWNNSGVANVFVKHTINDYNGNFWRVGRLIIE